MEKQVTINNGSVCSNKCPSSTSRSGRILICPTFPHKCKHDGQCSKKKSSQVSCQWIPFQDKLALASNIKCNNFQLEQVYGLMCQELSHRRKLLRLFPHFVPEKFQAKVSVSQNNEVIHWVLYPEVLDWKETMYYRWPLGLFRCWEGWVAAIVYVWKESSCGASEKPSPEIKQK